MKLDYRQRLLATTLFVGASLLATPAFAQPTGQEGDESDTPATGPIEGAPQEPINAQGEVVDQPSDIIVTGTRIPRPNVEAPSPVTVVNSEQVELTGTTTVESLLNELPQVIPGNTRVSNNAGGENFSTLDLRGLGPARTLILLDGERLPPSTTTGVVDVSQIPTGLIQRVEVVTGGASAVYGSDAIAGVVNFILKQNYQGLELVGQTGISEDGTGFSYTVSGLMGGNFGDDRGNLTVYGSWHDREAVSQARYDFSRVSAATYWAPGWAPCFGLGSGTCDLQPYVVDDPSEVIPGSTTLLAGGSATPPMGWIPNDANNPFQNLSTLIPGTFGAGNTNLDCDGVPDGAVDSSSLSFDEAGNLVPRAAVGFCTIPLRSIGSSRYNFAPVNYAITPYDRLQLTALGHWNFTDRTTLKLYSAYTNANQQVNLAPTPATGIVVDPTQSPFIQLGVAGAAPCGVGVSCHPDLLAALNSRPDPDAPFVINRRFSETGPRDGRFKTDSFTIRTVLEHEISPDWDVNFVAGFGKIDNVLRGIGNINATAVAQGLLGCPTGSLPNCVPVDIFGADTLFFTGPVDADDPTSAVIGEGDMLSFVRIDTQQQEHFEQIRAAVNLQGRAFSLPGGDVGIAVGAEYRKDSADTVVDDAQRTGNIYGFNAVQPISGEIDVKELYGEILLPIMNLLDIGFGARYSDYSTVGGLFNWKAEAEFRPLSWVKIRGTYNKAARAPNVFELFEAGDQGFPSFTDPCNSNLGNANARAICEQQAPAVDFSNFSQVNQQVQAFFFGNPNLEAEKATTYTLGAVLTPANVLGNPLTLTVDYYHITLKNRVASLGASFYASVCYNSDPATALATDACQRITRDPATGQVESINASTTNSDTPLVTSGVDVGLDWQFELPFLPGKFYLSDVLTWVDEFKIGDTDFVDTVFIGIGGVTPEWKNTLTTGYRTRKFTGQVRYIWTKGARQNFPGAELEGIWNDDDPARIPDLNLVNVSLRYAVNDRFELTGIINNLLDKYPPQTETGTFDQANTNAAFYDPYYVGRNYIVQARVRF